ncbi:MAG: ABC transporter ATP-binding protein/permease [Rubritepida sp.]|nr:ABC transporter ATP-binding protein/permease [Rubritepida sp.]
MSAAPTTSALRGLLALSAPWLGRWRTRAAFLVLLALTLVQVLLAVGVNLWSARFFDALEARDLGALGRAVGFFALLLLAIALSNAAHLEAKRGLTLGWRRALTERLLAAWLADGHHWRIAQLADSPDNPDGRIAEDIRVATEQAIELLATLVYCVALLVAFIGILWRLSGEVSVLGVPIPGHMVWLALAYAGAGAVAAFALGRQLTVATEQRQATEASFRFGLARVRGEGEGLALARGEALAREGLAERFGGLAAAWRRQTAGLRNLLGFQSAYVTLAPVFPLLIAAPRHLAGDLTLGGLMQTAQGFQQAVSALSWPVDQTARLAEWHASVDRLLALAEASEASEEGGGLVREQQGGALGLSAVLLRTPDGTALAAPVTALLGRGARAELVGEPRAVNALGLAIAGLWPWGEGKILRPAGVTLGALSREPWLPEVPLARLLAPAGGVPEAALAAALGEVGLPGLVPRLAETADWHAELDGAGRLRLAFARLLLAQPGLVVVEDVGGVLGEEELRRLMALLDAALPEAILLVADRGACGFGLRLALAPPEGLAPGGAVRAARRRREDRLLAWLRRGFGHTRR